VNSMDARRWGLVGWTAWTLGVLLAAGGAASRPEGWLLGWPGLPPALLLAAAAAALARGLGVAAGRLGLGLVGIPLLLLAGAPIPGLTALSGPPLFALALGVLALQVAASGPPRWAGRALLPVALAAYALTAWRVQVQVGPQGDEPHYLMVARSLLTDGDLALERDYAEGGYEEFHEAPLLPHYRVRGREGVLYSLHAVGLSLLILPAYAVGGYPAASFFMALLSALLAREVRSLVREWLGDDGTAEGVAWALAFSPPLLHYAGLIFTEVPAALGVAVALRSARGPGGALRSLAGGLAVAALPWLNARYGIVAAILVVYAIARRPGRSRVAAWVLPSVVSAAGLALFHHLLYGFLDPRRVYGRRPEFSLDVLPQGLPGLFLDQEFGLLVYAPVFALAVPGVVSLVRKWPREGVVLLALAAGVVGTAAVWPMWRGGFNPPARFLVPVVPALAVAVAARVSGGLTAGAAVLIGWGLWTGLTGAVDPRLVHRDRDGTAPLFRERSGAEEWTRLLPGYVLEESAGDRARLAAVWAVALGAAVFLSRRRPANAWGVAGVSLGLLGAAGLASRQSRARTEGREAVRLVHRPALAVPGWRSTEGAEWTPKDLPWGPVYEPHRHPGGAVIGHRLRLAGAVYDVRLSGEPVEGAAAPYIEVRGRAVSVLRWGQGPRGPELFGQVDTRAAAAPVTLALRGGGPFILKDIRLQRSTFSEEPGLIR
jgi:hypothetical protein